MAKITNAYDTYSATTNREALANTIFNLDPSATPFMSAIGTKNVNNVTFDWSTENLPSISAGGELEGFEISRAAATPVVRQSNVCQINSVNVTVSNSQESSDPAAKRSEMAHQMALLSKALKRNMEVAICQNQAKNSGNATTARATRSFEAWLSSNVSRGTGGSNGSASAAATDGTQRPLTETLLKGVLQSMFTNGAEPSMAIAGPFNKQVISGFTGRSNTRQNVAEDTVSASISLYASDFGTLKIVPSNRSRDRSLLLVDAEYLKHSFLRQFQSTDISTIGDAETKMIVAEHGLEVSSEQAHGIVADLTTS
jgi:23S rRNA pseudoU1915 N3-methylase RlmH